VISGPAEAAKAATKTTHKSSKKSRPFMQLRGKVGEGEEQDQGIK
jgi:hypothetical protein